MKRLFRQLLVALFIYTPIIANAQYKKINVGMMPNRMHIEQVDYYDNSTVVSISYESEEGIDWMNINENTYAETISGKKFPLINSINLPINTEAEKRDMLFDYVGQKHHFALEFGKIPVGETFDIIESLDNPMGFNFHDIAVDTLAKSDSMNLDEFIADYPIKERVVIMQDNKVVFSVRHKGLVLSLYVQAIKQYGTYYQVMFDLQNTTGKSVLLTSNNITAECYIANKKKQQWDIKPLKVYDSYEYDKKVRRKQSWNNFWVALGEGFAAYNAGQSYSTTNYSSSSYTIGSASASGYLGNTYGYANAYGSAYTTTYGQAQTRTYNGAAAYAAQQQANANYNAYVNNQSRIREQLNEGYMKNNTIRDGVEYSAFFNIEYKKNINHLRINFKVNGVDFPFFL